MKRKPINRASRQALAAENKNRPKTLTLMPREQWPSDRDPNRLLVLVSQKYLVQIFKEPHDVMRISVNRTKVKPSGEWDDNLSWDELMQIKNELGFADEYAVEVYPKEKDVVNVANMRHLWVLPDSLRFFGWHKDS